MNRYKELIKKVKNHYESGSPKLKDIPSGKKKFDLEWCPGLEEEINLWTYWQGGEKIKDGMRAEILLVGQDFGCCRKNNNMIPFVQELIKSSGNTTDRYVEEIRKHNKESYSDLNLFELFAALGNEYRDDTGRKRTLKTTE